MGSAYIINGEFSISALEETEKLYWLVCKTVSYVKSFVA